MKIHEVPFQRHQRPQSPRGKRGQLKRGFTEAAPACLCFCVPPRPSVCLSVCLSPHLSIHLCVSPLRNGGTLPRLTTP